MEAEKLLPCPFCGRDDATHGYVDDPKSPDHGGHFIQCANVLCGASVGLRYAEGDDPKPLLASQWNTRTPDNGLRDALEAAASVADAAAKRNHYKGTNPYLRDCYRARRLDARRIAKEIRALQALSQAPR